MLERTGDRDAIEGSILYLEGRVDQIQFASAISFAILFAMPL